MKGKELKMKRLNEEEFETMKWALNNEQLEEIRSKGRIQLNKEQMLDTLNNEIEKTSNALIEYSNYYNNTTNDDEKELMNKCLEGARIRVNDMQQLFNKLENDNEDYLQIFLKGNRG